jgi:hypothetical protein
MKVEGHTSSGASYSRVRTVSKYVRARLDATKSAVTLQPVSTQQPQVLRLTFTPRDLHGNLVGPGRASDIDLSVDKGTIRGKIEDLLDGSYGVEVEATERIEEMSLAVALDDTSIPVPVLAGVLPRPESTEMLKGKITQLRFDETAGFLGLTLRTLSGSAEIRFISCRLASLLAEAMEKNLTVLIAQNATTGEVTEVKIETP